MPLEDPRRIRCERRSVLFFSGLCRKQSYTNSCRPENETCRHERGLIASQSLTANEFYGMMRYNSPPLQLPDNAKILCIGNAGARWALNLALTHANALVVSLDDLCLPNTEPQVENHRVQPLRDMSRIPSNSQDVVRIVNFAGRAFWDMLLVEVHRVLKPGSILEICDYSRKFSDLADSPWQVASFVFDSFSSCGKNYNILASSTIGDTLMDAGFCKISEASLGLPFHTRQGAEFADTVVKELDGIRRFYEGFWDSPSVDWDTFPGNLKNSLRGAGVSL